MKRPELLFFIICIILLIVPLIWMNIASVSIDPNGENGSRSGMNITAVSIDPNGENGSTSGMNITAISIDPNGENGSSSGMNITTVAGDQISGNNPMFSRVNTSGFGNSIAVNRPLKGELIFNEILFDPVPVAGLPPYEYIELFNRSGRALDLIGLQLVAGQRKLDIPPYRLPSEAYLLLVYKGTSSSYPEADHIIELLPARTVLSNSGMVLLLNDTEGKTINWMEYHADFHVGEYQAEGGWSLERIDAGRPCHDRENWTSANGAPGGSPGYSNLSGGYFPDSKMPELADIIAKDSGHILMRFSEPLAVETMFPGSSKKQSGLPEDLKNAFTISPGIDIRNAYHPDPPFNREIELSLHPSLVKGMIYTLRIGGFLADCAGNSLPVPRKERIALPVPPVKGSFMINEILFNPLPFCIDFIELRHTGNLAHDLSGLRLAGRDPHTGELINIVPVCREAMMSYPEEYHVLTSDTDKAIGCYVNLDQQKLIHMADIPSLPDREGRLVLTDAYLNIIDEIYYNEEMHHSLIPNREGISLERISDAMWHSAAAAEGFSTPGRENSQRWPQEHPSELLMIGPELITPNLDGVDDLLYLRYNAVSPGLRANIYILNARGRLIRNLIANQLLGQSNSFSWDGTDNAGRMVRTGIYLVFIEIFNAKGRMQVYKETVVVACNP